MEAAYIRDLRNGKLISNAPIQFIRIPCIGESVQIGNIVWVVNMVIHAWRRPDDPFCEIRVMPVISDKNLPIEDSVHE